MLPRKRTGRREERETGGAILEADDAEDGMLETTDARKVGSRITGAGPWSGAIWPLTPKHENRARSGGRYPGQGLPARLYGGSGLGYPRA